MPYTPPRSSLTGNIIGPGSLTSGPTQPGRGAYGAVPTVPDPLQTLTKTLQGDIGNLADLYNLSLKTSDASAAAANEQFKKNLPLYDKLTAASSGNILSNLQGIIPQDVVNQLSTLAAQRGVSFGGGGPNANAALMSALGKTSLGLQSQGEDELTKAMGRTPTGPAFDPSKFLVSPDAEQMAQFYANLFGAAPNPGAAANKSLEELLKGLKTGAGAGPGPVGGGGGGLFNKDPLGFPITQPDYGAGGPGMVTGGPLGTPTTSNENLSAWNQWWNTGSQGPMTGGEGSYGQMTPEDADYLYGLGEDFQSGMPGDLTSAYGAGDFSGGDIFSDIGG